MKPAITTTTLALIMAMLPPPGFAADFSIEWYTIDGGGKSSSGGGWELTGAIGQPDAGETTPATWSLTGGFWAVFDRDCDAPPGTGPDCNTNAVPDSCDIAYGSSTDCNANGVLDECEVFAAPPAVIVGAVSRKLHGSGVGQADIALNVAGRVENHDLTSEPRISGVTELRIAFDQVPGDPGPNPVLLEAQVCPGGNPQDYSPFAGPAPVAYVEDHELVLSFWAGLTNARTYRLTLGPEISSVRCQRIEFRNLVGDANGDGRVDGTDRTTIIGTWTGAGFSPVTDINLDGRTSGSDRTVVIGAWTSAQNCAP
jgi:hypothetical protein